MVIVGEKARTKGGVAETLYRTKNTHKGSGEYVLQTDATISTCGSD